MHRLARLAAALLVSFLVRLCSADATGMVPGDVVLSNVSNFPGHAGIYIGRWSLLPQNIREAHAKAFAEAAVRSGSPEILDSYLVVDSMPSRGARISPMVEQFSDYHGGTNAYYPNLSKFDLPGALRFEADKDVDVRWPTLPDTDLRRWKIVETALELAENHVGYDDAHMQFATTWVGEAHRSLAGGT